MRNIYRCGKRYVESPSECSGEAELLIDSSKRVALSKLMSYILRHSPKDACIELEDGGWVSINELARGIKECWRNKELYQWITPDHIVAVASLDPKGRFEIRNNKIRAVYGHSKNIDPRKLPTYEEDTSVRALYHGTTSKLLLPILEQGIKPKKRHYVHLTTDPLIAEETGSRRGPPVILEVDADCLRSRGFKVFKASNVIYLVKYVPPECIRRVMKNVLTNS